MRTLSRFALAGVALLAACADRPVVGPAAPLEVSKHVTEGDGESLPFVAGEFDYSKNMHPLGFSPGVFPNTDLAFWGRLAVQGNFMGFRILDISAPAHPIVLSDYRDCDGDQGDVIIWRDIVVRSWDRSAPAGATCGGEPVPTGQQGVHVFDISNRSDPQVVAFVPTPCGSHTLTAVPDVANDRLLVYSSPSTNLNFCRGIDIIEVPLDDPGAAAYLSFLHSGDPSTDPPSGTKACHDTAVILGSVNLAACAGGSGFTVWTLDPALGGSPEEPGFLYTKSVPGVTIGHSASFTWDGRVLIFGHEPGGGIGARCQATSDLVDRTLFFFDARTGTELGTFIHPRPQTATENCTWHNYNVVPVGGRYVLVSGNYQSGISVVDFTDPSAAREIAFADPAPLSETELVFGGDWSTYWYNGFIYQSDSRRGLIVWNLSDPVVAGARRLGHLNPQTQDFSMP